MNIINKSLDGVLLINPPTVYEDFRGEYVEIYNKDIFKENGVKIDFIQDDISVSRKNVLRVLHGDQETWKLISCLYGSFYLVVVNNDPSSGQYKKSVSFTLSDKNRQQVLIPPKHGNGHLVLSDLAIFHYKQNTFYNIEGQFTIKLNDPKHNLWWPINDPITSIRDSK
jgi:dTDP-4-dehydrorhamnose 3,5-epimerase